MDTCDFFRILKVLMKISENYQVLDSILIDSSSTDVNFYLKNIQLFV